MGGRKRIKKKLNHMHVSALYLSKQHYSLACTSLSSSTCQTRRCSFSDAGQDSSLKQKEVNPNPATISAPPVRYGTAPEKPTVQPSPVKKAPVKAVPAVKKAPAPVNIAAKGKPTPVKTAQTKATESSNAKAVKATPPAKTISVKSVTQINSSPSEKVTAVVKTPQPTVNSKEVTTTKVTPAAKTPAEKVIPVAKTADKVTPVAKTAQKVTPATKIADTVTPDTKTAKKDPPVAAKTAGNVTPVAAKTADNVTPVAAKSTDEITPSAKSTEKVTPVTKTAVKSTPLAQSTPTKSEANVDANAMEKASAKPARAKKEEPKPLRKLTPEYSQAMAEELELIMIKIWENLPNDATSDAEKAAIETYRSDAGDELRNVLELGVKQRLLNIHNELSMKVTLEERPSPKWLATFKRKYRVLSTQRVTGDKASFMAEIGCFRDFDKLYAANRTRLGGMKVSLEPMYNFTREPNELRRLENLERRKTLSLTSSKKSPAIDKGSYNEDSGSKMDESMEEDESLDLFSMLEGGIVLDECMGSDDEK